MRFDLIETRSLIFFGLIGRAVRNTLSITTIITDNNILSKLFFETRIEAYFSIKSTPKSVAAEAGKSIIMMSNKQGEIRI